MVESDFIDWFHSLDRIDPRNTNHDLVSKLVKWANERRGGVFNAGSYLHGSGVTETVLCFAEFLKSEVIYVTSSLRLGKDIVGRRNSPLIIPRSWSLMTEDNMPLRTWDGFMIIDSPLSVSDSRSERTCAAFNHWCREIEFPAFMVN